MVRYFFALLNTAVIVLLVLPVVFIIWTAFYDSPFLTFPPPGYTFRWFKEALNHQAFVDGAITSFKLAIASATISTIIGIFSCLAITRRKFKGKFLISSLLLSPLVVPNIVLGIAIYVFFIWIADQGGYDLTQGIMGLLLAHTVLVLPWSVRLIAASLVGINTHLEEAATNLGANTFKTFIYVTMPLMRSGIIAAFIFSFIVSFENLEISLLLVGPNNTTFPIALIEYLEFNINPTIAAASVIQVLLIVILMIITDRHVKLSKVI